MGGVPRRIALTGGPGGGKTTVWTEATRRYPDAIVAVPEVATVLYQHLFPQVGSPDERRALQRAIFRVQCEVEAFHAARAQEGQILLCDRGTLDGGGFWPGGHTAFLSEMGTDQESELSRYHAVLFLETAASRGLSIAAGNEMRVEDAPAAIAIDQNLLALWRSHPRFEHVAPETDFGVKVERALATLDRWVLEL